MIRSLSVKACRILANGLHTSKSRWYEVERSGGENGGWGEGGCYNALRTGGSDDVAQCMTSNRMTVALKEHQRETVWEFYQYWICGEAYGAYPFQASSRINHISLPNTFFVLSTCSPHTTPPPPRQLLQFITKPTTSTPSVLVIATRQEQHPHHIPNR